MKQIYTFFAVMMMAMAMPKVAIAYDFSAVAPSGQTLYYDINGNNVTVVAPTTDNNSFGRWIGYTTPVGDLIIPESVIYLGITFTVTSIGDYAFFFDCTELTSVTIPSTVSYIGYAAFETCTSLTSVSIPNTVTYIGREAFDNCSSLTSVTLPNSITTISELTFSSCSNLVSVTIPNSVISIEFNAFAHCTNLDSVIIPSSVFSISSSAFNGCNNISYLNYNSNAFDPSYITHGNLHTVIIGNDVTSIPSSAFQNAPNLSHVTIGGNVTSISNYAFRLCTNLDTIVALPDIAPTLGTDVFLGTPNTKLVFINCNADYASVWGTTGFIYITGYTLALESNNALYGTASIVQPVNCQQTAIIQATPAARCVFTGWSDGNTDNPRTITLTGNTTLTANFALTREVVVQSANEVMGTTEGSGIHVVGSEVTLSAIATCGFRFTHWQDGNVSNPRTITLGNDTMFTAYFELHSDTVVMHDTAYVNIHDTTYIDVHDTSYINVYVHDTTYIDVPVYDTTIVTDTVTEYVVVHDTTYVDVPYPVHDTTVIHDTTYVDVPYPVHDTMTVVDTLTITDTLMVLDTLWQIQYDTVWLHDTVTVHDTIYIHDEGIDGIETVDAKIYQRDGRIVVESGDGGPLGEVRVFDVMGRNVATGDAACRVSTDGTNRTTFEVPTSGAYIVKIGNRTAKKIVVIR